ncbi:hypothetical protein [Arsenicicoccus dermatophilus]|uniref:hypothetical protein n=1 Tax=Arsenicicoccus dermatophilus TaxID=1076331 RepID=UPI001F4C899C|nr:hypothetical protein [Arsenicicoccus dermatophilus]MCH8614265.1 hypothetical protein [Arsenicicoccus dermatophilus]
MPDDDVRRPPRSWASRLGEGLVMTISLLVLRLVMRGLGLLHEPFLETLTQAVLFGALWVAIAWSWDRIRTRRDRA